MLKVGVCLFQLPQDLQAFPVHIAEPAGEVQQNDAGDRHHGLPEKPDQKGQALLYDIGNIIKN